MPQWNGTIKFPTGGKYPIGSLPGGTKGEAQTLNWKGGPELLQLIFKYFVLNGSDTYSAIQTKVPESCFYFKTYAPDPDNLTKPNTRILASSIYTNTHPGSHYNRKIGQIDHKDFFSTADLGPSIFHKLENYLNENGFVIHRYDGADRSIDYAGKPSERTSIIKKTTGTSLPNKIGLNTILYGPPGTGKTFNTINYAVAILLDQDVDEIKRANENEIPVSDGTNSKKVKEWYDYFYTNNQIRFVTLHQSFSYEDFIEGIQPVMDSNDLQYTIKPGIFKEFCSFNTNEEMKVKFDEAWNSLVDTASKNKGDYTFTRSRTGNTFKASLEGEEKFRVTWKGGTHNDLRKNNVKQQWFDGEDSRPDAHNGNQWQFDAIQAVISELNKYGLPENPKIQNKRRVFIIDEINRGNISKIFGELITLIEDTKRKGMPEATFAMLPLSNSKFSVPKEVYILGTMNTADRSIAMLDTALRRRFDFVEMLPEPECLKKVDGIDLQKMLEKINLRLQALLDREHTIGHAFFMNVSSIDDIAQAFKRKVLPLLQEYFFEDYEKIGLVLNDFSTFSIASKVQFIHEEKVANKLFSFRTNSAYDDVLEQPIYRIDWTLIQWLNPSLYLKIYNDSTEVLELVNSKFVEKNPEKQNTENGTSWTSEAIPIDELSSNNEEPQEEDVDESSTNFTSDVETSAAENSNEG